MNPFWQYINDRKRWPKFIRRVNVSIRRFKRREVLTFLLFVAIAAFFWTVQSSREESVQDFIVQFQITSQPQDMVFTTHVPTTLRVSLSDTNSKLFNYGYNHRLQTLTVDFERYADAVGDFRISAAELQSLLSEQLMNTTRIVAVSPALIDARFAQTEGRKFIVKTNGSYTPAPDYRMRQVSISPDSVIINAPSSVLDTLSFVVAVDSCHWNLRDTLVQELELELPIGVKATPSKVKVTVPVVQYVEKVFDQIVLQVTDVPKGRQLVVFPYAVQIRCLVDFADYRAITSEMFTASVSYLDITKNIEPGSLSFLPIHIEYHGPTDVVTNIVTEPSKAEYVIE